MKVYLSQGEIPQSGVSAIVEGTLLRLYFDFEEVPAVTTDDETIPACLSAENVDITTGKDYGSIVAAIVNSKYSNDDVQAIFADKGLADDSESTITDEKRAEYLEDYNTFQQWRVKAKEVAVKALEILAK